MGLCNDRFCLHDFAWHIIHSDQHYFENFGDNIFPNGSHGQEVSFRFSLDEKNQSNAFLQNMNHSIPQNGLGYSGFLDACGIFGFGCNNVWGSENYNVFTGSWTHERSYVEGTAKWSIELVDANGNEITENRPLKNKDYIYIKNNFKDSSSGYHYYSYLSFCQDTGVVYTRGAHNGSQGAIDERHADTTLWQIIRLKSIEG